MVDGTHQPIRTPPRASGIIIIIATTTGLNLLFALGIPLAILTREEALSKDLLLKGMLLQTYCFDVE